MFQTHFSNKKPVPQKPDMLKIECLDDNVNHNLTIVNEQTTENNDSKSQASFVVNGDFVQ